MKPGHIVSYIWRGIRFSRRERVLQAFLAKQKHKQTVEELAKSAQVWPSTIMEIIFALLDKKIIQSFRNPNKPQDYPEGRLYQITPEGINKAQEELSSKR
jgi:hypothetical protein